MGVVNGRQARTDIQKLPDTYRSGEISNGPSQKDPRMAGNVLHTWIDVPQFLGQLAVGRIVVLSAQPEVPDPGLMRLAGVDPGEECGIQG
ncbi:hypothetical protein HD596_002249 [Nonomuraea jabiensis]|uniref:Uncharacterized protein n=1 Tax=Nonomuraea jabiensis TaxID=882448 RepID=A0A7W9G1K2_9ACTN|nr:hypothetical protein [Nonomuraea jabiensis]